MTIHQLEKWREAKSRLFDLNAPLTDDRKVFDAVLGYLIRSLTRGRIPDPDIAFDALQGKTTIPSCGRIECFMDAEMGEHVH